MKTHQGTRGFTRAGKSPGRSMQISIAMVLSMLIPGALLAGARGHVCDEVQSHQARVAHALVCPAGNSNPPTESHLMTPEETAEQTEPNTADAIDLTAPPRNGVLGSFRLGVDLMSRKSTPNLQLETES